VDAVAPTNNNNNNDDPIFMKEALLLISGMFINIICHINLLLK